MRTITLTILLAIITLCRAGDAARVPCFRGELAEDESHGRTPRKHAWQAASWPSACFRGVVGGLLVVANSPRKHGTHVELTHDQILHFVFSRSG
jgi:hypothetical protein